MHRYGLRVHLKLQNSENICGSNQFRLPELDANTNVIMCAEDNRICTPPHRCLFSKMINDYICCKSTNRQMPTNSLPEDPFFATTHRPRHSTISRKIRSCPNSENPLLFPGTNQPVKCTPHRACPNNYFCSQNICCKDSSATESVDEE